MLQQSVDQFIPRIVLLLRGRQRIARQQQLRLDMNQHCGHINKLGRNVHVQLANLLHIRQILRRNLGDRNVVNIDVLLADQVQQQVQRAFVYIGHRDGKREVALFLLLRGFLRLTSGRSCNDRRSDYCQFTLRLDFCLFSHAIPIRLVFSSAAKDLCTWLGAYLLSATFGASYASDIPIAARTSSIVSPAALRAFCVPASRISHASRGFSSNFLRRSCIGFSSLTSASAAHPLHSMHPISAERQPLFTFAIVSLSLKILWRSPTGQRSGFPGSDRRTRAGSVTIVFNFWRITGSGSASMIVFP